MGINHSIPPLSNCEISTYRISLGLSQRARRSGHYMDKSAKESRTSTSAEPNPPARLHPKNSTNHSTLAHSTCHHFVHHISHLASSSCSSHTHLTISILHHNQSSKATMASLAASTAPATLGKSEMLGSPLKFSPSTSAAAVQSSSSSKIVALFSRKPKPAKAKPAPVSPASDELAKWYGPDRRIFLPEGLLDREEVPEYLNGEVPGDYGYDPFGLSKKPEDFAKYQGYEVIHARWAMLGAAGFIIPEAFNKYGAYCGPEAVWFKTGALLLDGNTLSYFGQNIPINLVAAVIAEIVLVGGAEYFRITNGLDLEDKLHPGGPFDPLGLATDPDQAALLKVKEIKNGRLAMFAMLGFFIQAYVTGDGPVENLSKHLSDPFGNNLLTVISGGAERVPTL